MVGKIDYSLRQAADEDYDFLYQLHVASMRPYVEPLWGWEESWQQEYFARKFDPLNRKIIQFEGQDAGVLVVERREQELYLALIEILPNFQGQGIGTAIVSNLFELGREQELPISLHVLKSNKPARRLYERLGFVVSAEEEYRFKMIYYPQDKTHGSEK